MTDRPYPASPLASRSVQSERLTEPDVSEEATLGPQPGSEPPTAGSASGSANLLPDISAVAYHADTFTDGPPSLSASLAHTLLTRSPRHAWSAHPRLNPNWEPQDEPKFDIGRVAHQVLLEGNANIVVVDADDWRTNAAKAARDEARMVYMTALLRADWERVLEMVAAVHEQLAECGHDPIPFTVGRPEVTLAWSEPNGVSCRARIDWLHDGNDLITDLKTTTRSARGDAWSRGPLFDHGCDVQCAFYRRGVEAVTGVRPDWRWVVVESAPPYALQIVRPGADVWALGDAKVDEALRLWAECLATDDWPAYGTGVFEAEVPPWLMARWLEREEMAA